MSNKGYVYVLSNPSMPGIVKIGRSMYGGQGRADVFYKNDTAVPTPFELEFERECDDCVFVERSAHQALVDSRVNNAREFFRCPVGSAINTVMDSIIESVDYGRQEEVKELQTLLKRTREECERYRTAKKNRKDIATYQAEFDGLKLGNDHALVLHQLCHKYVLGIYGKSVDHPGFCYLPMDEFASLVSMDEQRINSIFEVLGSLDLVFITTDEEGRQVYRVNAKAKQWFGDGGGELERAKRFGNDVYTLTKAASGLVIFLCSEFAKGWENRDRNECMYRHPVEFGVIHDQLGMSEDQCAKALHTFDRMGLLSLGTSTDGTELSYGVSRLLTEWVDEVTAGE